MSWFGRRQVGYQSWVLAVSGFICLLTRHPSGNVKYEAAYVGVEFRESPRPVLYKDMLFKTSKLRSPTKWASKEKTSCPMTKLWGTPTLTAWEDWDGTSERGREEAARKAREESDETGVSWPPREAIKKGGWMSTALNVLLTETVLLLGQTLKKWGGCLRSGSLHHLLRSSHHSKNPHSASRSPKIPF